MLPKALRSMGLEPHYSYFPEDTDRQRPSVWAVLDSCKPGKTMLLIGHIDTVDVNLKNWKTNPFHAGRNRRQGLRPRIHGYERRRRRDSHDG